MRIYLTLCILALCLVACERGQAVPQPTTNGPTVGKYTPGDYAETLTSGGQTRRYRLHVPKNYQQGTTMTLVLNLHGLNESAAQQERLSNMSAKADQAGFIVVYPEGVGSPQNWKIGP